MTTDERERLLRPLLEHLSAEAGSTSERAPAHTWHTWRITPIGGGSNNLLYHATVPTA